MKINCIIIDDEPFAANILEDDLLDFPTICLLEKFNSPLDVPIFFQKNQVDLIFSDIQMPEMLGTQFIRNLANPPLVIFTTAYHQYALEGFELNAVDYLMKPIRKERLAAAIKKVENLLLLKLENSSKNEKNYITINIEYQKVKLYHDEIIYIEGLKDYVKIYLENRIHPLMTRSNLRGMEGKLPEKHFTRIHNSFIVNTKKISGFQHTKVLLAKIELPIGKAYLDNLKALGGIL
jgi:DNA-binding LytR/AlgR family response regulator